MCFLLNYSERKITERSYYKLARKYLKTRNVYVATDLVSSDEPFGPFVYFVISVRFLFQGIDIDPLNTSIGTHPDGARPVFFFISTINRVKKRLSSPFFIL